MALRRQSQKPQMLKALSRKEQFRIISKKLAMGIIEHIFITQIMKNNILNNQQTAY